LQAETNYLVSAFFVNEREQTGFPDEDRFAGNLQLEQVGFPDEDRFAGNLQLEQVGFPDEDRFAGNFRVEQVGFPDEGRFTGNFRSGNESGRNIFPMVNIIYSQIGYIRKKAVNTVK